jgi:hypothetical protein
VSVQAAAAASFRLDGFRTDVQAGVPVTFTLVPLDSNGNPTTSKAQLRFFSDDTLAELPPDTPTSDTTDLPKQFTVTFRSPSATPRSFKVADVSAVPNISLTTSVLVQAGAPEHVKLSTDSAEVPVGCGNGTVKLAAFDSQNIPASAPVIVTLCKDANRLPTSATFVSSTLGSYSLEGPCITGELKGTAEVVWTDMVAQEVEFSVVSGLRATNTLKITWTGSPVPSSTESTLEFVEPSTSQPPELQTYSGPRTVKLTLRDACRRAMPLPVGQSPSFAADAPLAVSSAQQDPTSTHVWTASVRLSSCPADKTVPLALWPIVDNEPWRGASTTQRVAPKCSAPLKIHLLSSADSLWVEPGATTEFELEVSNTVDVPVPDAILMAEVEGLTVIKATLDGEPLAAKKYGFALPELRKDAPLKVKVQVQATTQPEQAMLAQVWCEDLGANWLSGQTPVSLNADKLGVDVGCGCHTATPAGQLLPWLLLLLAGSRPWVRLRRLRRGERTEH